MFIEIFICIYWSFEQTVIVYCNMCNQIKNNTSKVKHICFYYSVMYVGHDGNKPSLIFMYVK